jgi:hypothetical protein
VVGKSSGAVEPTGLGKGRPMTAWAPAAALEMWETEAVWETGVG